MSALSAGNVIADPVGVIVRLVAEADPAMSMEDIRSEVTRVAGGRAKRRRLAQAIHDEPSLLTTGGPPVSRAAGELLLGLRAAGSEMIAAPRCGGCGRSVSYLAGSAGGLICASCRDKPQSCAGCGEERRVHTRDRHDRPRCEHCPGEDGDPVPLLIATVTEIDPAVSAGTVTAALGKATARPAGQRRLAWAIVDQPALLTSDGSRAPSPAVLRFIDELIRAGGTRILPPRCARCDRAVSLSKLLDGQRVCRACCARAKAVPCCRCGSVREPSARDADGGPLCPNCLVSDPANLEVCVNCGRRRVVNTRSPHGPLCPSCPPLSVATCSICGQHRPCGTSRLTGRPWCPPCQNRSARCASCGQVKPVGSGTLDKPRCRDCTVPAFPDCPVCATSPRPGQCPGCRLELRLRELLTGPDGGIHPSLRPLKHALTVTDPPGTALRWLAKQPVATVLADIAAGGRRLTHAELDRLEQTAILAHLRSVLVATGTLPPRDEQMARLERFISDVLADRTDPDQRQILRRYAVWHLLRRLRRRNNGQATTIQQYAVVHQHIRAAVVLLDWLNAEHLTLATCRQADLERWLTGDQASHCYHAGHFVRWATRQRLATLSFPATRWQGPARALDDQARWDAARRLLHDDTVSMRDRLAGLLVLLYAQPVARISRLTTGHVTTDCTTVRIRLGPAPITLPGPVADLTRQLLDGKRGHATTGAGDPSPWLFPGGQPGRPVSATHLGQRLKDLGIQPGQARSTALFQLAAELPAALLARMLGIHIDVAVAWQHASAGDWMTYAADVSRRHNTLIPASPGDQP